MGFLILLGIVVGWVGNEENGFWMVLKKFKIEFIDRY